MKIPVPVVIVVAMERTSRAVGYHNELLWHIPADMRRFKALTLGHPVIMGRKTFESITAMLGKPLPERTNIVVTRNQHYTYEADNVQVVTSLEDAFAVALRESPTEIHIGGGAELYHQALPYTTHIHATFVEKPSVIADTFFPAFTEAFEAKTTHAPQQHGDLRYQWVDFERKRVSQQSA